MQFKISNVISLATNEWFLRLVVVALIGTMVTYYAQALIGVGKGSLFYHTGTVVLLVFAHYRLKERFTSKQLAGAGLILLGSVLVTI